MLKNGQKMAFSDLFFSFLFSAVMGRYSLLTALLPIQFKPSASARKLVLYPEKWIF